MHENANRGLWVLEFELHDLKDKLSDEIKYHFDHNQQSLSRGHQGQCIYDHPPALKYFEIRLDNPHIDMQNFCKKNRQRH